MIFVVYGSIIVYNVAFKRMECGQWKIYSPYLLVKY